MLNRKFIASSCYWMRGDGRKYHCVFTAGQSGLYSQAAVYNWLGVLVYSGRAHRPGWVRRKQSADLLQPTGWILSAKLPSSEQRRGKTSSIQFSYNSRHEFSSRQVKFLFVQMVQTVFIGQKSKSSQNPVLHYFKSGSWKMMWWKWSQSSQRGKIFSLLIDVIFGGD